MLPTHYDHEELFLPCDVGIESDSTRRLSPYSDLQESPKMHADPYAAYIVSDLHLSRLGLNAWASESVSSTTSSSLAASPPSFSPRLSCASPVQSSSIWAPIASTSALPSVTEVDEGDTVVLTPRRRKAKTYTCQRDKCGKVFNRSSGLRRHLMVHTGDRPFACPMDGCDKAFVQPSALKVHQRVHTGVKPHVCEYDGCHKSFADPSCLAKHRRTHHVVKPFQCSVVDCHITFKRRATRDRHVVHCARRGVDTSTDGQQLMLGRAEPVMSATSMLFAAAAEPWPPFMDPALVPELLPEFDGIIPMPQAV